MDDDQDGISNDQDLCLFTPQGASIDSDGCQIFTTLGCMNEYADNYNSEATEDDGTCTYSSKGLLIREDIFNSTSANLSALELDGANICVGVGTIMEETLQNFFSSNEISFTSVGIADQAEATDKLISGECDAMVGNFDDLVTRKEQMDADNSIENGLWLATIPTIGCTNQNANNYNLAATVDDNSCNFDLDDDGILDSDEIAGCTNQVANNYNIAATDDDGSCDYDLDDDGIVDSLDIPGCTNSTANNYDSNALQDDGTCDYDLDNDGILDVDEVEGQGGADPTTSDILTDYLPYIIAVIAGLFAITVVLRRGKNEDILDEVTTLKSDIERKYRKSDLIGEGGMAKVYRAVEITTGIAVVWKEAASSRGNPLPEVNARLLDESELLSGLNHPRIPKHIDSGEIQNDNGENVVVMIMEYIDGPNLKSDITSLLKRGRNFTIKEAIDTIKEICEPLDYMADLDPPVYHRDIKPANIIIDDTKGPVLIDFGLAKGVDAGTDMSLSRGLSEGWSPQERNKGISGPFTDVFSLGQILWHLLTGEETFNALDLDEIKEKIIEKEHPEWIAEVIHASAQRYDRRIQSVFEFKLMLENEDNYQE